MRRYLFSPTAVRVCWVVNIVAFCILVGWIWNDGRFAETGRRLHSNLQSLVQSKPATAGNETQHAGRTWALNAIIAVGLLSGAVVFAGLFFGPPSHRRVRSWLSVTVLLVIWLTLWAKWPELQWRGQAHRLSGKIGGFQEIAAALNKNWPTIDGELPQTGPFLAYPDGKPKVLLLLTQFDVPGTGVSYSTVERSDQDALRFHLTGNELGTWLEWHPAHDLPASFTGGVQQHYELQRQVPLGDDWFLVRYR